MILTNAQKNDYKLVKNLYLTAFPPEERPPFFLLKWRAIRGNGQLLVAREAEEFIGFVYLIQDEQLVYLFFFAVEDCARGSGYGSKILDLVKERSRGKRIFLAREPLDDGAENNGQRIRRRNFYLRNGFEDLPIHIVEQGYRFEAMGIGGPIAPEEYDALITAWLGKAFRKWIPMRMESDDGA